MRIRFSNTNSLKTASKYLSKKTSTKLCDSQNLLAKALGYQDLFDLQHKLDSGEKVPASLDKNESITSIFDLTKNISSKFDCRIGEALHAITKFGLVNTRSLSFQDLLEVRARLFDDIEFGNVKRRNSGQVGWVKSPGWKNEKVIFRCRDSNDTCYVFSNKTPNTTLAVFEYMSPKMKIPLFIPNRLFMPYGYVVDENNDKIIFSRDYVPLWRLRPNGAVSRDVEICDINLHAKEHKFLWDEGYMPLDGEVRIKFGYELLAGFGIRCLPKLIEFLPQIINTEGYADIKSIIGLRSESIFTAT